MRNTRKHRTAIPFLHDSGTRLQSSSDPFHPIVSFFSPGVDESQVVVAKKKSFQVTSGDAFSDNAEHMVSATNVHDTALASTAATVEAFEPLHFECLLSSSKIPTSEYHSIEPSREWPLARGRYREGSCYEVQDCSSRPMRRTA